MSLFQNIEFVTTVADARMLPPAHGAEVAFVGRSNAGKSTAINTLAGRKRMAFVSKTPGRTQHINFFSVGPDRFLVDLPGYGYAAVAATERARWHVLIGEYLQSRACLRGVVLIMDARHPLTPLDCQLLDWLQPTGLPVLALLNKADKLSRQEATATLRRVVAAFALRGPQHRVQLFSSPHKIGVAETADVIRNWLDGGPENKKPPV